MPLPLPLPSVLFHRLSNTEQMPLHSRLSRLRPSDQHNGDKGNLRSILALQGTEQLPTHSIYHQLSIHLCIEAWVGMDHSSMPTSQNHWIQNNVFAWPLLIKVANSPRPFQQNSSSMTVAKCNSSAPCSTTHTKAFCISHVHTDSLFINSYLMNMLVQWRYNLFLSFANLKYACWHQLCLQGQIPKDKDSIN